MRVNEPGTAHIGYSHDFGNAVSADGRLAAAVAVKWEADPDAPARPVPQPRGLVVFDALTGLPVDRIPDVPTARLLVTPDSRRVVAADTAGIGVWDLATRKRVVWHPAHATTPGDFGRSFVSCWDVTPDGRTLATGHPDGTVLLWDLPAGGGGAAAPLAAGRLAELWEALAGEDPAEAYAAGWELDARPAQAVELLRAKLTPARPADGATVAKLVEGLDAPAFADREAAEEELSRLGAAAAPALRRALASARTSAEQRVRVNRVLASITAPGPPAAGDLPGLRGVSVLDRVRTKDAVDLLGRLAGGAADARLTREAKEALERVAPSGRLRDMP
jgi:hypothetical protein